MTEICNAKKVDGTACIKKAVWLGRCLIHQQSYDNCSMTSPRPRCQALSPEGKQCRNASVRYVKYHGNPEIYGSYTNGKEPAWVKISLCWMHSDQNKRQK